MRKARNWRLAAYCRVSTDNEEQQTSYAKQKEHYTNLIDNNPDWDLMVPSSPIYQGLKTEKYKCTLLILLHPVKREQMSATTGCCADLFTKEKVSVTIQPMASCSLRM